MICVLHIGTEKTATTLLQQWLRHNRAELSRQRIYLPDFPGDPGNRSFANFFQSHIDDWSIANGTRTIDQKRAFFEGFLERLSAQIREAAKEHDIFLISSEHLHSRLQNPDDIRTLRAFLDENFEASKVICYFRDQADMAISLYSTALRGPFFASLDESLERARPEHYYFNFARIASNWSAAFGRENCIFRIFDRAQFASGDIRIDFIRNVDDRVDTSSLDFSVASANMRLSRLLAAAYRKINEIIPYWTNNGRSIESRNIALKQKLAEIDSLKRGAIDHDWRPIRERFASSNEAFFAEYFDGKSMFPPPANGRHNEVALPIEDVEQIVTDLMACLLPHVGDDDTPRLFDSDANYLRDIAISIENGAPLSLENASKLMTLAQRARPQGKVISEKVAAYRQRLNRDAAG